MTFVSTEEKGLGSIPDPPIRVFGNEQVYIVTRIGAFEGRGISQADRAIWRNSFTRAATRAADAVFSIMGLLGGDFRATGLWPR
jgi:hypothetical protein